MDGTTSVFNLVIGATTVLSVFVTGATAYIRHEIKSRIDPTVARVERIDNKVNGLVIDFSHVREDLAVLKDRSDRAHPPHGE